MPEASHSLRLKPRRSWAETAAFATFSSMALFSMVRPTTEFTYEHIRQKRVKQAILNSPRLVGPRGSQPVATRRQLHATSGAWPARPDLPGTSEVLPYARLPLDSAEAERRGVVYHPKHSRVAATKIDQPTPRALVAIRSVFSVLRQPVDLLESLVEAAAASQYEVRLECSQNGPKGYSRPLPGRVGRSLARPVANVLLHVVVKRHRIPERGEACTIIDRATVEQGRRDS